MRIAVFGLGFVGLTTALGFADKGYSVRGYDINQERCAEIAGGKVPFFEPGLDDALARNLGKTFILADSAIDAADQSDICFFCVGTPGLPDGSADLAQLLLAIDSVLETVSEVCVLVVKSTIPPGTLNERVTPYVRAKGAGNPVAVNPEFLREGKCWDDFMNPDRIVCGVTDDAAKNVLAELYKLFGAPLHYVEPNTAEFIKYLSNSLLAALISYSNEMALLADAVDGIETARAFRILHEDRRLAGAGINTYIYPGCGYGGYCLPKDIAALDAVALNRGFTPRILEGVISLNNEMPELTARKIARAAGEKTEKIGILGLSFKRGSDDVRDSPAAKIIGALVQGGYVSIYAYDPLAMQEFHNTYRLSITYCASANEVCETCGTVALVTAWDEFQGIDKTFPDTRFVDCRYFLG
ncbi:UDP-glucose/GDP-mannose dehydrogenase family protein [Paenibacillus albiflavus]|uniref:UDP-glucose 6-dehydrogenase n=1 Tax=Paenibacillus albiflavus TaxID=2545760 RepID=A0A4R4E7S1_9BACL|nr:nucleotide sugar dehydrogenase [Paenibacillus albiflavus]TCZ73798.1 UDP-glucose/GDP-mannose dehydrogenase family protein [Paenibacillus albiflavus]